jgi:uncharacterized protein YbjQ (UPF0145 family)
MPKSGLVGASYRLSTQPLGARVSEPRGLAMLSSTTFEIPGYRVVKSLGVVRGITVRTRSLPMTIIGGLRTLFGGRAGIFAELCESARVEAFQLMQKHAAQIGANAVIGVRYDTGPMVGAAEVLCYGTAVVVEQQ